MDCFLIVSTSNPLDPKVRSNWINARKGMSTAIEADLLIPVATRTPPVTRIENPLKKLKSEAKRKVWLCRVHGYLKRGYHIRLRQSN
jgi:hypothetical protein